jgi:hypothetical protein
MQNTYAPLKKMKSLSKTLLSASKDLNRRAGGARRNFTSGTCYEGPLDAKVRNYHVKWYFAFENYPPMRLFPLRSAPGLTFHPVSGVTIVVFSARKR